MKNVIILIYSCLVFYGCQVSDNKNSSILFGTNNATWTESIYFRGHQPSTLEALTDEYIHTYAERLKLGSVKYGYFFAGPFDSTGHLPAYAFSDTALQTIKKFKSYYPDLVILPWIGGLQNKTVFLGDLSWVNNAISDCKKLVNTLGVEGVHVDFEYILPGDTALDKEVLPWDREDMERYPINVNEFHKRLRDSLPSAFISSVVTSSCSQSKHWKRKTTLPELRELVRFIDQLNFLFYDTSISDTAIFRLAAEEQMGHLVELKKVKDVQMLMAIGTFTNPDAFAAYHDPNVEDIAGSLRTIREAALRVSPHRKVLEGIAIYAGWQTSKAEWDLINRNWNQVINK